METVYGKCAKWRNLSNSGTLMNIFKNIKDLWNKYTHNTVLSRLISRKTLKEVKEIENFIEEIGKGSFDSRLRENMEGELGHLAKNLNLMVENLLKHQTELDEKIRAQQNYLLTILNESKDGIISLDVDDRVITWNRGAEQIYGYKADEIVGKSFEILVPENLRNQGEMRKMQEVLKEKGYLRHYETERIRKDGKKIIVDITRTAVKNEKGEYTGSSSIIKDVTERKEFEKRITQTEKLTTVGQISANIAHEIKNPLMGISGAVQVLMKKLEGNPPARETLSKIFEQVQRLDSTLKGLLSFARPQTPYFLKGNVNEIIDQVLFFVAPEAETKRVRITKEMARELPSISLDPDQIKQVFLNIILNALQAMPLGGDLIIRTSNGNGGSSGDIKIVISDTGSGIPEKIRDEIFRPFFTTKIKGTGLGLAICKNIVKEHGGNINFTTELNKGTSFEITLPKEQ
jgi:PAS domain S-box-containing protein